MDNYRLELTKIGVVEELKQNTKNKGRNLHRVEASQ